MALPPLTDGKKSMAELSDLEIDAVLERGLAARKVGPRAAAARYDDKSGFIIIDLTNGCTFAFPTKLAQGLEQATNSQLASVEIIGQGYGLHWEDLDVDLSLPGLMAGIFGTQSYIARRADQAKSPSNAAASRANDSSVGTPPDTLQNFTSERLQGRAREVAKVVTVSAAVVGDILKAIYWFLNEPIADSEHKTAAELVAEGRSEAVLSYLRDLENGARG
jgi:hypothetical protein